MKSILLNPYSSIIQWMTHFLLLKKSLSIPYFVVFNLR